MISDQLSSALQRFVDELLQTYPFYQALSFPGGSPEFHTLPIVDKQLISKYRTLFEHPSLGDIIETFTSGTTGVPFRCIKTPMERNQLSLVLFKHRKKWGLPTTHNMVLLSERLLTDTKALEHYASQIIRKRPQMVQGRASTLVTLAAYFAEKQYTVPDQLLFFQNWGEQISTEQREQIKRHLGVPAVDYYGMEEMWCIAFANKDGELEIDEQSVYVEIIDPETKQTLPNGEYGEVIVTSFIMRSLPFVRYRTGDIGRLIRNPETSALLLQLMPIRISQIKLPDRVLPAALLRYLDRFFWELSQAKGIRQFQVRQETYTTFRLLVVSDIDLSNDTALLSKLAGFLRQCLAAEIELIIETVTAIAPNPQSGKLQSFVSLVS